MWSRFQRMFAIFIAAFAVLSVTAAAQMQGHWVKLAPLPEPSEEYTFTAANGKIYLLGGNSVPGKVSPGLVQEYDPATDKWTKKKDMPIRANHMAATEYHGKIYVFGGQELMEGGRGQIPIDKAWEYDPAADSWKALAPMSAPRTAAAAAEVGGKIYVMGGNSVHPGMQLVPITPTTPHRSLATNEVYDPATNRWEARQQMPTARNHTAIGVVNGKVYVIGGRVGGASLGTSSNTDLVEVYDPAADMWGVPGAKMPTPRTGIGWATHQGKIFVAGGELYDSSIHAVYGIFEAYDPATNTWSKLPPISPPRHGVNLAAIGNRIYVIGGHIAGGPDGGEAAHSNANNAIEFTDR